MGNSSLVFLLLNKKAAHVSLVQVHVQCHVLLYSRKLSEGETFQISRFYSHPGSFRHVMPIHAISLKVFLKLSLLIDSRIFSPIESFPLYDSIKNMGSINLNTLEQPQTTAL